MSPPNRLWLAIASIIAISGCVMGPNFKRPAPLAATGYAMPGDDAAPAVFVSAPPNAGAWWRAFKSDDLDAVVIKALQGNQELAKIDATLAQAEAEEAVTRGGRLPSLKANGGLQREKINTTAFGFSGFPSPTISLYSIGGVIAYDFDVFGERKRRIESAKARVESTMHRAEAAYLTLTGRVARQAIEIASLRAQIAAANAVVDDDRKNLDLVHRAQAACGAPAIASTPAEAQLAHDMAELPPLEQRLAEVRHGLALLVGQAPANWSAPLFELTDLELPGAVPLVVPSELVRKRPDILASEAALHEALADVGVAKAERFPKVSLTAQMTQATTSASDIFKDTASGWSLGGGLTAPLFQGGALSANQRAKEAAANEALASYRQTVLQAFVQVADTLEALKHDADELDALTRAERSAAKSLRDARVAYEKGGAPFINILDAQRLRNGASKDLAAARGRQLSDFVLLYVATAANWQDAQIAEVPAP
jgi:NodT family efflux transporter outer membrane factor (OMF) lipoprotein